MGVINTNWNPKHATCAPKSNSVPKYNENGELTSNTPKTTDDSYKVANTQFVQRVAGTKSSRSNIIHEFVNTSALITLPVEENWSSVLYGDGRTVVIGGSNITYKNEEGIWELVEDTKLNNLSYGAYGAGIFIALSHDTGMIYSEDGIVWLESDTGADKGWSDVVYGDGLFVAVPMTGDTCIYSNDGLVWQTAQLPTFANWTAIAYGNGKFVAVDNLGTIIYSTDGVTWETSSLPLASDWTDIAYGNGKFVAVGEGSGVAYSTDAITWIMSTVPIDASWSTVAYGNGLFMLAAHDADVLVYSTSGSSWYTSTLPLTADWSDIGNVGDGFMIISSDQSTQSIYIDVDVPTLFANKWDTSGKFPTYTIQSELIMSGDTVVELYPNKNIAADEYAALQYASIIGGDQGKGYITLVAMGELPTIDIPINLIVRGDM